MKASLEGNFALPGEIIDALAEAVAARVVQRLNLDGPIHEGRWLTTPQAADYLGLTVAALHKLTAARQIPFEQAGPSQVPGRGVRRARSRRR